MKKIPPTATPRFVLVAAIDASPDADRVIDAAAAFARTIAGAELHLVHAIDAHAGSGVPIAQVATGLLDRARAYLDGQAQAAQTQSGVNVVAHLRQCEAALAILQTSASVDADLVMVGTHDREGISRWLLGSVSERVVREASCPAIVVRPKHHVMSRAPEIEPPCDDCLRVQRESSGSKLWCARHSEHHPIAHLHYEMPQGFGAGSSLIQPE